jgi:hypothetical protein
MTYNEARVDDIKNTLERLNIEKHNLGQVRARLNASGYNKTDFHTIGMIDQIATDIKDLNTELLRLQEPEVLMYFGGQFSTSTKSVRVRLHHVFVDGYSFGEYQFSQLFYLKNMKLCGKVAVGNEFVKIGCSTGTWDQIEQIWAAWQVLRSKHGLGPLTIHQLEVKELR